MQFRTALTEVFLHFDSNADGFRGLHVLAQILANVVHVFLQDLVVIPCPVQLRLAQSILCIAQKV
jgi:hypothetical protein